MSTSPRALVAVALAGCVPVPQSYVANVHYEYGALVAETCDFDHRGHATRTCHTEAVDGAPEPWSPPPDPPELAKAARAAAAPVELRPAPTANDVARALASPSLRRSIELCRASYARDMRRFAFTLTVAPTGEIAVAPHGVDGPFADCATRAVGSANIGPYDGAAVSFEQQLVL